jgi:hypothetical protein
MRIPTIGTTGSQPRRGKVANGVHRSACEAKHAQSSASIFGIDIICDLGF